MEVTTANPRDVDLNLTVWDGSAQVARDRSGTPSRAVGPVLPPIYRDPVTPAERASARAALRKRGAAQGR